VTGDTGGIVLPAARFAPSHRIYLYPSTPCRHIPELLSVRMQQIRPVRIKRLHLHKDKISAVGRTACRNLVTSRSGEISVESQFDKGTNIFHNFPAMEDLYE
jgi:hypothetical protein